jgi:hypothetical protein
MFNISLPYANPCSSLSLGPSRVPLENHRISNLVRRLCKIRESEPKIPKTYHNEINKLDGNDPVHWIHEKVKPNGNQFLCVVLSHPTTEPGVTNISFARTIKNTQLKYAVKKSRPQTNQRISELIKINFQQGPQIHEQIIEDLTLAGAQGVCFLVLLSTPGSATGDPMCKKSRP